MRDAFWWRGPISDLLFHNFNLKTPAAIVSVCVGLMALAFAFEWLKLLQAKYKQRELFLRARQLKSVCPTESSTLLGRRETQEGTGAITVKDRILLFGHELVLWISLQNLGYLLMLCVMVYNVWLVVAVIAGGTIGYFVFGQKFMKINLQNCQVMRDTYCMLKCDEPGPSGVVRDGESTPAVQETASTCHQHTAHVHTSINQDS